MAISFLQEKSNVTSTSTGNTLSVTFTNPIAAGSIIAIAAITNIDASLTTYTFTTDKVGDSPTDSGLGIVSDSAIGVQGVIAAFLSPTTGAQTVTLTTNINFPVGFCELVVWEIAGLTGAVVDKKISGTTTGTTSATSGSTGTLSAANEAAIGYGIGNWAYASQGASWSLDEIATYTNDLIEHRVVSSNAAIAATGTIGNTVEARMWCVTFMSGGGPQTASATLAGAGGQTASATTPQQFASSTLAGAGGLTSAPSTPQQFASSTLAGAGGLTSAPSTPQQFASTALAGAGSLTEADKPLRAASATLGGIGSLSATPSTGQVQTASTLFAGAGSLIEADSGAIQFTSAALFGAGGITTALSTPQQFTSALLAGAGQQTASPGTPVQFASATLQGNGNLFTATQGTAVQVDNFSKGAQGGWVPGVFGRMADFPVPAPTSPITAFQTIDIRPSATALLFGIMAASSTHGSDTPDPLTITVDPSGAAQVMTLLGPKVESGGTQAGPLWLFGLVNPVTGNDIDIEIAWTDQTNHQEFYILSVSFTGTKTSSVADCFYGFNTAHDAGSATAFGGVSTSASVASSDMAISMHINPIVGYADPAVNATGTEIDRDQNVTNNAYAQYFNGSGSVVFAEADNIGGGGTSDFWCAAIVAIAAPSGGQTIASALLSGIGGLAEGDSGAVQFSSASLAGTAGLTTAPATPQQFASSTLVGVGSLSAQAFFTASAVLSGIGSLSATPSAGQVRTASSVLAGTGALIEADSGTVQFASSVLAGTGALLEADSGAVQFASGTLAGIGNLASAVTTPQQFASAVLAGIGVLTVNNSVQLSGATFGGLGGLSATAQGFNVFTASALLSGAGGLSSNTLLVARASLSGVGALSGDGYVAEFVSAVLAGAGALSEADSGAVKFCSATFGGVGTLAADANIPGAAIIASARLAAVGGLTAVATGGTGPPTGSGGEWIIMARRRGKR